MLALLAAAVLVPTACLVYFLNEAAEKERVLAHRELQEAYAGQIRLVARQIDQFWEQRGRELDARTESEQPSQFFEHCVRDGLADSVILLNRDGSPVYPSLTATPRPDDTLSRADWADARGLESLGRSAEAAKRYRVIAAREQDADRKARAEQAEIRCLAAAGESGEAVRAIEDWFGDIRQQYATDLSGRIIRADELLLRLRLKGGDPQRLYGIVQNYANPIPSSQRLFLMDQLRAMKIEKRFQTFPTYQAERAAERVLSDGHAAPGDGMLRMSGTAGIWSMTSPGKSAIALYGTARVMREIERFTKSPGGPPFTVASGNAPSGAETIGRMPGWWIRMDRVPALSAAGSNRRIAAYGWIGLLVIVVVSVLAAIGAGMLQRQMRVAHLKTDLVAAVSHELKTPLASMKALVESLLSGAEFDPGRTREYLQMVARENSRLSRLIDNFLTFSRMERNRGKFDFARVQPQDVIRAAMESVGDRFRVEVECQSGLPGLYADEDALVTVLLNLLDNAYKYSGDNRRIRLRASSEGGWVRFVVEDNGIGIPAREQRRIFRRFYQVDRALSRTTGGVGLGLSIVEFIVRAHRGTVSVESQAGAGSRFTVSLPASASAQEAAA